MTVGLRALHRGVEGVDGVAVHPVDERGADERPGDLRPHVREHLRPGELAAYRERQGHRRVDVRSADAAGDIHTEDHGHRPAPGDEQPVTGADEERGGSRCAAGPGQGRDGHRHDTAPEGDEYERSEELRQAFASESCPTPEIRGLDQGGISTAMGPLRLSSGAPKRGWVPSLRSHPNVSRPGGTGSDAPRPRVPRRPHSDAPSHRRPPRRPGPAPDGATARRPRPSDGAGSSSVRPAGRRRSSSSRRRSASDR